MEPDWKYLAAFFDGEGTLTWTLNECGMPLPKIGVTNTDLELIESIKREVGGRIELNNNHRRNPNYKRCYTLFMGDVKSKLTFLKGIRPFIRRREFEVDIVIAYLQVGKGRGSPLTDTEKIRKIKLFEMLEKK